MRRPKKSGNFRYIDGKRYYLLGSTNTKYEANRAAKHYRAQGSKIRVLKARHHSSYDGPSYEIWELDE